MGLPLYGSERSILGLKGHSLVRSCIGAVRYCILGSASTDDQLATLLCSASVNLCIVSMMIMS